MSYLNAFADYTNNGDGISLDELANKSASEWSGAGQGIAGGLYGVGAIGAKGVGLAGAGLLELARPLVPDQYIDDSQNFLFKYVVDMPAQKRLEFMSHNKTTASQIAYGVTEGLGSLVYGGPAGGAIAQGINKAEETIREGGSVEKALAKGVVQGGFFYAGAKVAGAAPVIPGSSVISTIAQKAVTGGAINTALGVAQRTAEQGVEAATDGTFNTDKIFNYANVGTDFGMGAAFGILSRTNKPEFNDLPIEQKDASLTVVEDAYIGGKIPVVEDPIEAKNIQLDLIETEKALDENREPGYLAAKEQPLVETAQPTEPSLPETAPKIDTNLGEYEGINLDEMAAKFDNKRQYLDENGTVKTFAQLKESAAKDIEESKTTIDKLQKAVDCILGAK